MRAPYVFLGRFGAIISGIIEIDMRKTFSLVLFVVAGLSLNLRAQDSAAQQNVLRPPAGSKVAIVEFEDLECPDCANAAPLVQEAQKTYHIPLVIYDFPLPKHPWARQAAIIAKYFDHKSKKLGDEFRNYCFDHQPGDNKQSPTINTPDDLRAAAEQFAAAHHMTLPLIVDPQGKLEAEVNRDVNTGIQIGITHTPTIYVVTDKTQGQPFVEIVDRSNLFSQIDQAIAETGGPSPRAEKLHKTKKSSSPTT
jgi:protein-disulfide isomerase